ncbi:MAG: hypothetical protein ACPGUV_13605, partial [Polyangiales bacterium]
MMYFDLGLWGCREQRAGLRQWWVVAVCSLSVGACAVAGEAVLEKDKFSGSFIDKDFKSELLNGVGKLTLSRSASEEKRTITGSIIASRVVITSPGDKYAEAPSSDATFIATYQALSHADKEGDSSRCNQESQHNSSVYEKIEASQGSIAVVLLDKPVEYPKRRLSLEIWEERDLTRVTGWCNGSLCASKRFALAQKMQTYGGENPDSWVDFPPYFPPSYFDYTIWKQSMEPEDTG